MLSQFVTQPLDKTFVDEIDGYWLRLQDQASVEQQAELEQAMAEADFAPRLAKVMVGSEFFAENCIQTPALLLQLWQSKALELSYSAAEFHQQLAELCSPINSDQELDQVLRKFRRWHMLRIIWRDLNQLAELEETTADMSSLAEATVQRALEYHYQILVERFGYPRGKDSGLVQPLVVLGMGKLGARELNVSSDIDLIFTYPESGETEHTAEAIAASKRAKKTTSNQEFFNRLGQKLINSIDTQSVYGFVFRVDMRLRPYGDSGSLVLNYDSMEEYYQTQGREWERYAMIKARVIALGGCELCTQGEAGKPAPDYDQQIMELLRPFSYRRYIDFSAIDALRDMKSMINREVQRKGKSQDVKLGYGGIREVEFIVQVFQLIRGGRDLRLQKPQVLTLLPLLEEDGYLPEGAGARLATAYRFLRHVEHGIQAYQDKQTQALPDTEQGLARLAWVLGFDSYQAMDKVLSQHRNNVNEEFQAVIAEPEAEQQDDGGVRQWKLLWQDGLDDEQALALLEEQGFIQAESILGKIKDFRQSRPILAMQSEGRDRLDKFIPQLMMMLSKGRNPEEDVAETLGRVLALATSVARRTIYLVLLTENPMALSQLARLCAASPWIADQLAKSPALLDELLDHRTLYSTLSKSDLRDLLRQETLRIEWDDLEQQMEALRYFRMANVLRIAACEVTDALPVMNVSDHLTDIAEVILEYVLQISWQQMVARHGHPRDENDQAVTEPDFIVVGYGKLGGGELGHGSDLDLVFIHNGAKGKYTTGIDDGKRSIDNLTFYTRMGQKMIHTMDTQTMSGQLYEVDMRLRPDGTSGMLVSSLEGFKKYQRQEAWTWEHQALVRARVVVGDSGLAEQFVQVRNNILAQARDLNKLGTEVVTMREKMRKHLSSDQKMEKEGSRFDLKQDAGGIVDIEFMVQYAVLAWAHKEASLLRWTDNIRILGALQQAGYLSEQDKSQLVSAYKAYRSAGHRLALQRQKSVLTGSSHFQAERQTVQRIWQLLLGNQDINEVNLTI